MKRIVLIVFLFSTCLSFSQFNIDSLKQVVNTTKNDSIKVQTYLRLLVAYARTDANASLEYAIKAQELALKDGNEFGYANAKYREASVLRDLGEYSKSDTALIEALKIYNKLENLEGITSVIVEQANILQEQSRLEEASELYLEALPYTIKAEDKNTEARIHNNLGSLYKSLKQNDKAVEHFKIALALAKELNFKPAISAILTNLGGVDYNDNDYSRAENHLNEALVLKKEMGDKLGESRVLANIARIKINKKEYSLAEANYLLANNLALEVKNQQQLSITGYGLAEAAFLKEDYKQCIKLCNTLLPTLIELNQIEISIEIYEFLSKSHNKLGEYKNAFDFAEMHNKLSDSLYNDNILSVTNELEAKYQNKQKVNEIEQLKSQNELVEQQKTNQRNLLLGGLGFTSLIGLFFFLQYKNRKKINTKLKELDASKSNFFVNISHEFRTPLTLILGPIKKLLKNENINIEDRSNLEMMQRNSNRLLSLVNELLDISKIEEGRFKLKVSQKPILPLIQTLTNSFVFKAEQNEIEYKIS
ncbi:MAG: tetratricopeptide repeat protein, partial [Flavobacteriaceae bacterium]|nr:tetratricopeptide repeat protein [Flavobacteriaceae bacterium]